MSPKPTLPNRSQRVLCLCMNPALDLATETERVVPTHKLRCGEALNDAGGGGVNVARVLARLGAAPQLLSLAGGPTGAWLAQRLQSEGLDATLLPMAKDTRISFTVHESSTGAEYRFVMPGPVLADTEWRACLDHLEALPKWPAWLVASGSLPPGVPADFYARLARLCRARGTRLVLDTAGPPLAAALAEGVYLVKPNLRELRELTGQALAEPADWMAAAQALVQRGQAAAVALTLGHQGAVLATRDGLWRGDPLPIEVASAVGAGDSFLGAMVWALDHDRLWHDALSWGVAAGSAALLTAGTGLCDPAQVRALQPQVRVRSLSGGDMSGGDASQRSSR